MRKANADFWNDAIERNIYYAKYVLPSGIAIHITAFIGIDLHLVGVDYPISMILRLIPILYLAFLMISMKYYLEKIKDKILILFFLAGLLSSLPVIFHAGLDLLDNGSLYSGGMGIFVLKVIMTMFVFLKRRMMYLLYILIDVFTVITYYYVANENFIELIHLFIIYTFLSNTVLLISYYVYYDLRKTIFYNKQQLEKELKFKENYFGFLAHDIRTPVSLMQSVTELLKSQEITEERREYYINRLDLQLDSMNNLVINILNWLKSTNQEIKINPVLVKFNSTLEKCLDLNNRLEVANELILNKKLSEFNDIIFDPQTLEIVLNNLIRNAYKFADAKSEILIRTEKVDNRFCFVITNTGIEFDDKQLEMFNNGESVYPKNGTRGEKGHGLGLEIVKNLTQLNNSEFQILKHQNSTTSKLFIPLM